MSAVLWTGVRTLSQPGRCLGCGASLSSCTPKKWNTFSTLKPKRSFEIQSTRFYARGQSQHSRDGPIVRYLRTLRWVPIPLGVGFAYISYQQYGHVVKREEKKIQQTSDPEELLASDWVVRSYKCLPLKIISRLWGKANNLELPVSLRSPLFKSYIWMFGCNMDEAAIRDLQHYRNLAEFFRRRLRPGVRPVDSKHSVVCPSDGIVLHLGKANHGVLEQVKGITYSLQDFFGPLSWTDSENQPVNALPQTKDGLQKNTTHKRLARYARDVVNSADNELYHCVIYLAPGDYHGFHSPAQWVIAHRRHFPGELLSVNPGIARLVKGLFNINERAVYFGQWEHGFFSMAAVGATNVGNIKVYHDKTLFTNEPMKFESGEYSDSSFRNIDIKGIAMKKGEPFGEFNLGSTIVLVFEAPKNFKFRIEPGQKVKFGQALGTVK